MAHVREAILPIPLSIPLSLPPVVLIAHVSLEQRDRWYPADLRDNLIQHRDSGYVIQTLEKPENLLDIK